MSSATCGRVVEFGHGLTTRPAGITTWRSARKKIPTLARPVGLFQCLVPHRRAAELFVLGEQEIQ